MIEYKEYIFVMAGSHQSFSPCVCGSSVHWEGAEVCEAATCSCLAPPIGFIIFFKLMKICNINSYYLLVQMVDIFPYFPHFMEELKKNISKTRGQTGLMLL